MTTASLLPLHTTQSASSLRLRDQFEGVFGYWLGLNRLYRWLGPTARHIVVLNYHHIDADDFARQLSYLREQHRIVGLDEAVACVGRESPWPRHRVSLTFDDAFESFRTDVYPHLLSAGVTATLFVPTGLLGQVPFWLSVARAVSRSRRTEIRWRGRDWSLSTPYAANKSRAGMVDLLKSLYPASRRDEAVAELFEQLGVTAAEAETDCPRIMTADRLAELDPSVVRLGAHTRSHPRLSALAARDLDAEIAGGRAELEELLGRPVRDFAYPYGRAEDVSPAAVAAVERAGLRSGFTTQKGACRPGAEVYHLPRVDLTGRESRPALAARAGGLTRFLKSAGQSE